MSIVDSIREQLERPDGIRAEELQSLASAYSEEVAKVNQRLNNCSLLLRKGLRSEAIQHANMRPSLLELAAQLDFPELDDFTEILQFYELPVPSPLNRASVQQLQEALVEQQPLNELLRQHRWLAIAKAPLGWRLRVLRSIAKLDSLNPLWFEDIEAWEKARLIEIPKELKIATSARSYEDCKRLADELTKTRWQVSLPQALVESAQAAATKLEYDDQCRELKSIGQALYDAFCAQDEATTQSHRADWNSLTQLMKQPPPKELTDFVEPALLWLQDVDVKEMELESHRQAVADLQRVLAKPKSVLDVEHAYHLAANSGFELESTLQRRVQSVIAEMQLAARRRTLLRVVSVASLATVLLVALAFWQWRNMRTGAIQKSVASLQQLLTEDRLDEGQHFVEQLSVNSPYILKDTQIQGLLSDLEGRLTAQRQRTAEFEAIVVQLEETSADQIDVGMLNSAEKLARTDTEKGRVSKLRRAQQEAERTIETRQLADVRTAIEGFSAELNRLESTPLEALNHYSFDRVISDLDNLKIQYPRAGSTGRDLINNVARRAGNLRHSVRQALDAMEEKAEALERIHKANSLQTLRQALESYASKIKDATAGEFAEALKEKDHWTAVDHWNEVCTKANSLMSQTSPEGAKELLDLLGSLEKKADLQAIGVELPTVKTNLEAIGRRPEEFEKLKKTLSDSVLSMVYTMEITLNPPGPAQRYFVYAKNVNKAPQAFPVSGGPGRRSFDIVSETNGAVKKINAATPIQKIVKEPSEFLGRLAEHLSLRGDQYVAAWEESLLDLLGRVHDVKDIDSSAREALIAMIIEVGRKGSVYLDEHLRSILEELKLRQKSKPWVEPAAPSYVLDDGIRKQLNRAIDEARGNLRNASADLHRLAGSSVLWVGSLLPDSQGRVAPWLVQSPKSNGKLLMVIAHPTLTDSSRVVQIGQIRDGNVSVDAESSQMLAGRPLFFVPSL